MSRSFICRIVPTTVLDAIRGAAGVVAGVACIAGMLATTTTAHAQGLFAPPTSTPSTVSTGVTPQGIAAADFAHSGFQSLAVVTNTDNALNVYLGKGNGTFAAGAQSSTCAGPSVVLAQDVNNDSYADIVVACPSSNTIELFLNKGAGAPGTFGLFPDYTETVPDPVAMVLGDFQGDGVQSLAVASGTGGVTIIADQNGSLGTSTVNVGGTTLTGITAGDFNHDGHLDLAVSDSASSNVHVVFGNGDGTFGGPTSYSTGSGSKPSAIGTADFNHDGNLDLAVTNAGTGTVGIMLGTATGTFGTATTQSVGQTPVGLSITDVNSDGNPDVIVYDNATATSGSQDAYVVLLGSGTSTLQAAQVSPLGDLPGAEAAVVDFNRDGKPDLAITQQTANEVLLLQNNTLPTQLDNGRSYATYAPQAAGNGNMADSVATGDFNHDGKLDVAVTYLEDNAVKVLLNNGGGGFTLSSTLATGAQPYTVASGDLNGDGAPDLVTVNTSVNSAQGTISVFLNKGNGTFNPGVTYTVGRLPYQVAIGDVNGDGYPDLAVSNYGASTVSVLYGSKNGTFTAGPTLTVGSGETNPYGIAIGDFQGNGHPDIAVAAFETNTLYVFPNNGSGAFGAPYSYATGNGPMSLVTGDFNRDGKLDIVVSNATGAPAGVSNPPPATSGNNVSFFAGNGNGTFKAQVISPNLNFPDSIAAADINGDGILDIVGVAPNFNAVEVTLGAGDGTFGTIQQRAAGQFTAKTQPWALALGDFNNDGKVDIVTANTFNQVNISIPAYMSRYMTQYPPVTGGNPSVALLYNASGANIVLTHSPSGAIPAVNTGVTVTATVSPALTGSTPTGSVIFENNFGSPLGTGPYALAAGKASYTTGALGSGSYVFTTLYSGDTNYQPTTVSGTPFTVTVTGTPVTLTINPISVVYSSTFTANVTVTGTPAGGVPKGTVAIDGSLGTLTPITLVNGSGTGTFTAISPNFKVGQYELYALYTSTNGYTSGSSAPVLVTVTGEPTTTAISCTFGLGGTNCTATVKVASTGAPVPAGNTVDFTVSGTTGSTPATTNANGQATFTYGTLIGTFTITATFPQQSYYLSSNASQQGGCILFICDVVGTAPHPLTTLTGSGFEENFTPNAKLNRNVLFTLF